MPKDPVSARLDLGLRLTQAGCPLDGQRPIIQAPTHGDVQASVVQRLVSRTPRLCQPSEATAGSWTIDGALFPGSLGSDPWLILLEPSFLVRC